MINHLYNGYKKELQNYKKIYDYYLGHTDALKNYVTTDRSNQMVGLNYLKKFVKEETAYSVGNPISYQSKTENFEATKELDLVMENYIENHDINTFSMMVLFGIVYEITYIDKWDELQVKFIKPIEGFHIEDDEGNITNFIHVYTRIEYEDDLEVTNTYIDEYTESEINTYKVKDEPELIETREHYFGEIPVGMARISENTWKDTLFNDIKGLQDAIETNTSDVVNEISDFRNAYMVLTGLVLDEEEAKKLKQTGIIEMQNPEGKVEWLIKNINDTFVKNTLGDLHEKLFEITSHINHNDAEAMSNASGVALKSRLIALTQRCAINEGAYKELLKTRIRLIFAYLKVSKNLNYNWKDIKIRFTPSIPNDDAQTASLIQKLNGKLSAATGLELLSFVENGKEEYEKAQQEQSRENALNEVAANVRSVRNYIDKFTEEDPETEFNSIVEEKSLLTGSDIGEFSYKSDNIEEDEIEQEQRLEEQKINE